MWDQYREENPTWQQDAHPLSFDVCHILRGDLCRLINGESLDQLPHLQRRIATLAQISVSERPVERKHRMVAIALDRAYNLSAPLISLQERLPAIKRFLGKDPSRLEQLAVNCERSYHPLQALRALGFQQHPSVEHAFRGGGLLGPGGDYSTHAKQVIYRLDTYAQHRDLEGTVPPHGPGPRPSRRASRGAGGSMDAFGRLLGRAGLARFNEVALVGYRYNG